MKKTRRLTQYEPMGDIVYEENIDSKIVTKRELYMSSAFAAIVFAMFLILGGSIEESLLISLLSTIPSGFLLISHRRIAKKVFFRIRSHGIEAGTPLEEGFIPFDKVVWMGPSPKPFSYEIERRFNVVDVQSLYPAPLLITPQGLMVVFNVTDYTYGLIIYPSDIFAEKIQDELEKRFRSGYTKTDGT
jgi:hypothetical protein